LKIGAFLFVIFLSSSVCLSQVNKIKSKSSDNSSDRSINKSNHSSSSSNNSNSNNRQSGNLNNNNNSSRTYNSQTDADQLKAFKKDDTDLSCFSACNSGCGTVGFFFQLINQQQKNLFLSKPVNPRIYSIESGIFVGQNLNYYSSIIQARIRYAIGMFGSEIRRSILIEPGVDEYSTIDVQLLQLNIFSRREFWLRLGGGFMYEDFSGIFFQEYALQSDIKFERKLTASVDMRFAYDNITNTYPRIETGFRFNYKLFRLPWLQLDWTFGLQYQNYYQTIQLFQLQSGLNIMIY
jgi:hypothetical protein